MRLKDSSGDIQELVHTQIALEEGEQRGNLLNGASYHGTIFKALYIKMFDWCSLILLIHPP